MILGVATLYIQNKITMLLVKDLFNGLGVVYQCFLFPKTKQKAFPIKKIKNVEVIEFLERMDEIGRFETFYFQANLLSLLHKTAGIWP